MPLYQQRACVHAPSAYNFTDGVGLSILSHVLNAPKRDSVTRIFISDFAKNYLYLRLLSILLVPFPFFLQFGKIFGRCTTAPLLTTPGVNVKMPEKKVFFHIWLDNIGYQFTIIVCFEKLNVQFKM
jgi:hypothetical protein